jgi:outer membrane protein assembly factor BamD
MKRNLSLILILTVLILGCSSAPDELVVADRGEEVLYQDAKQKLAVGNFSGAAELLSALDSRYPYGAYSHSVQLDLIYAYYKSGKTAETLATIDRFIRLNPNHSDVDYVYYMRGLTQMDLDNDLFQSMLGLDRADKDPTSSRQAFADFRRLIQRYPQSKYAADARKRMVYIKNRLAKYEIAIARFYMRRQAYVAAANRGKYVLEHYSDSSQLQQALEIMVESYDQLGLLELKRNALKTLRLNFPSSSFAG